MTALWPAPVLVKEEEDGLSVSGLLWLSSIGNVVQMVK
jgi:hypothetical protein